MTSTENSSTENTVSIALAENMARAARDWYAHDTLADLCPVIVAAAASHWSETAVGITRLVHHRPSTVAASNDLPRVVDALQYELAEGPGPDGFATANDGSELIVTGDLEVDPRWPVFGPRAATETGVHSVLVVRLHAGQDTVGLLSLCSPAHNAFDEPSVTRATIFATHAALALARAGTAEQVENLSTALQTNRQIGAAIGILMSQHRITEDRAFELLRLVSQHANRKLRDVADDVVQTGTLPTERIG